MEIKADFALHPWVRESPTDCLTIYECFWCGVKHRADDFYFWDNHKKAHPDKFPDDQGHFGKESKW